MKENERLKQIKALERVIDADLNLISNPLTFKGILKKSLSSTGTVFAFLSIFITGWIVLEFLSHQLFKDGHLDLTIQILCVLSVFGLFTGFVVEIVVNSTTTSTVNSLERTSLALLNLSTKNYYFIVFTCQLKGSNFLVKTTATPVNYLPFLKKRKFVSEENVDVATLRQFLNKTVSDINSFFLHQ